MEKIFTENKSLVDSYGRERIFFGVNLCDKGQYSEKDNKRHYIYDWDDSIFENFKKRGFNIIRLGITWDAVEPEKGKYNEEYIESVRKTLDKCEKAGIYAYVDMHQDLYSGYGDGPGDGAPAWATYTDKYKYKNPRLVWAESYFISKATHRAFDNFWDNNYGVQDDYIKMWKHIAEKLKDHPALLGFDVMNEPFMGKDGGKIFIKIIASLVKTTITDKRISKKKLLKEALTKGRQIHILDLYTPDIFSSIVNKAAPLVNKFDKGRYMPFLNKITGEIREVNAEPIIFMENSYYSNLGIKCEIEPIKVNGKQVPNQVFTPHAYDLMVDTPAYKYANNGRVKGIFDRRKYEQDNNLNIPVLVGEWGGNSEGTSWLHHIEFLLNLFDEYKWSSTYWAYWNGMFNSPVDEVLKRPYPRAVTGKITSYKHDRDANTFTLKYEQDKEYEAPTEIFVHKPVEKIEAQGEYTIEPVDDTSSVVKIKTGVGSQRIFIKFKGEGFSYLSRKVQE